MAADGWEGMAGIGDWLATAVPGPRRCLMRPQAREMYCRSVYALCLVCIVVATAVVLILTIAVVVAATAATSTTKKNHCC